MQSRILKIAAAFLALGASGVSSAAIVNLGALDTSGSTFSHSFYRFFGAGDALGVSTDIYNFSLSAPSGATGGVISFEDGFVGLDLLSVRLSGGTLGSALVDNSPSAFTFNGLGAGLYSLAVRYDLSSFWLLDIGSAIYQGSIRATSSQPTTSVPEPTTFGLLGAALAALAFVGRRRRKA